MKPLQCTFDQGYIDQPVYACIPCMKKNNSMSGMCKNCFQVCHLGCGNVIENVDYYAIEKKRNFKCDCGTKKLGNNRNV